MHVRFFPFQQIRVHIFFVWYNWQSTLAYKQTIYKNIVVARSKSNKRIVQLTQNIGILFKCILLFEWVPPYMLSGENVSKYF